jgi:hypothetical protein
MESHERIPRNEFDLKHNLNDLPIDHELKRETLKHLGRQRISRSDIEDCFAYFRNEAKKSSSPTRLVRIRKYAEAAHLWCKRKTSQSRLLLEELTQTERTIDDAEKRVHAPGKEH